MNALKQALSMIDEQREKWIAAINEGSASGFVAVLADDVVWLPSRHDAIRGREAIFAWLEEPFAAFDYDYAVSEVRIRVAGDWAVEQARFSTRARTEDGEEMPPHVGLYTLLWRKTRAGTWLIERYIDHSGTFMRLD